MLWLQSPRALGTLREAIESGAVPGLDPDLELAGFQQLGLGPKEGGGWEGLGPSDPTKTEALESERALEGMGAAHTPSMTRDTESKDS